MKNKTFILFLTLNVFLLACNSNAEKENVILGKADVVEKIDTINPKNKVVSKIRPTENILCNKIYTDTIQFLNYNEDYDYKLLIGKKNEQDVTLVCDWDWNANSKYKFNKGDFLKVTWKMDSLYIDCETLDLKERAISAEIVSKSKYVFFLWREDLYNDELQQVISTIVINEPFCTTITVQEKAAIGYLVTFIGNECEWDGAVNESRSNLKCTILTALNLGYQCSDSHLGFLKQWFSKDENVLSKLGICPTIPEGATIQSTFEEITLFNDNVAKTIAITYKVIGMNVRESKNWEYTKTDIFKYDSHNIWLISSKSINE